MSRSLVLASLSAQLPDKTNSMTTSNTQGLPDLSRLFPVRIFKITLRFTRKSSFPFLHHAIVNGFVRNLTNPSDPHLAPPAHKEYVTVAPESGRIEYHAGDDYCFYLIAFAGIAPSINTLFEQLKQLPASARKQGCTRQLSDKNELVSIQDAISLIPLETPEQATPLALEQFIDAAAQLQGRTANVNVMIGPLRMLREKENVNTKTAAKFCTKKSEFTGTLFFQRIYDSINNLVVELGGQRQIRSAYTEGKTHLDNIATVVKDAFWVDSYYQNDQTSAKENGGLFAHCELNTSEFTNDDFLLLLIGELLGICQKRNFGYGRYTTGLMPLPIFSRHNHLVDTLFCSTAKLEEVKAGLPVKQQNFVNTEKIQHAIIKNQYQPSALFPKLLESPSKNRLLLLANSKDKFVQKVISGFISQSLDTLFSKVSFGYRKGLSRSDAATRIQYLFRKGYKYALDADITDFFGSVNIAIVINRLKMLYGADTLWPLIENFLRAPIQREHLPEGYEQFEARGLPIGSSLSPALANLTLDYFDVMMEKSNRCLVRYADDFLILTKTQEEATTAKTEIAHFLAEQGFELHPKKTVVRAFSDGIYFLGYLFVNDLVVNATARMMKDSTMDSDDLAPEESIAPTINEAAEKDTLQYFHKNQLQSVCVTGPVSTIFSRQGQICIYAKEKLLQEIPVNHIDLLILFGKHNLSTPALLNLLEKGAQVHFASAFGRYIGSASTSSNNPELHLRQANLFANQPLALTFAKKLIIARIRSQREVLRQRELDHQQLSDIINLADAATNSESLMGHEAQAAKRYWAAIREYLGSEWLFLKREKPNSKDPFNSLLNMGYSLLFAHIETLARAAGLYPSIGAYHKGQHYSSLAADLMEPFRYVVERKALAMISRKQIKVSDFEWQTNGLCLLSAPLRKLWVSQLIDELQAPKYSNGEEHFSLLDAVHQQNKSLISWLEGDERFTAWMPR